MLEPQTVNRDQKMGQPAAGQEPASCFTGIRWQKSASYRCAQKQYTTWTLATLCPRSCRVAPEVTQLFAVLRVLPCDVLGSSIFHSVSELINTPALQPKGHSLFVSVAMTQHVRSPSQKRTTLHQCWHRLLGQAVSSNS